MIASKQRVTYEGGKILNLEHNPTGVKRGSAKLCAKQNSRAFIRFNLKNYALEKIYKDQIYDR